MSRNKHKTAHGYKNKYSLIPFATNTQCTYTPTQQTARPRTFLWQTEKGESSIQMCSERLTGGKRGEHLLPLLHRSSRPSLVLDLPRRPHVDCKQSEKSHLGRSWATLKRNRSAFLRVVSGNNVAASSGDFPRARAKSHVRDSKSRGEKEGPNDLARARARTPTRNDGNRRSRESALCTRALCCRGGCRRTFYWQVDRAENTYPKERRCGSIAPFSCVRARFTGVIYSVSSPIRDSVQ